mmetsp:Transcript_4827/g.16557  ORF Transcript_4827/g.16557 Transcript_4827/m.16557 type:complete len:84 (-) Transcript_4827:5838-6089(-)
MKKQEETKLRLTKASRSHDRRRSLPSYLFPEYLKHFDPILLGNCSSGKGIGREYPFLFLRKKNEVSTINLGKLRAMYHPSCVL